MSLEGSLSTPTNPWKVLRTASPEDGAAAAAIETGFTFYQKKDSCVDLNTLFSYDFGGLLIIMYGDSYGGQTCDDNDAFGFDLIGYREPLIGYTSVGGYNPPMRICSAAGTAVVGGARASGDGGVTETGRWMDSVTLTNSQWPGDIRKYADGNDKMMFLEFDACGIRYIYPYVWGADGLQAGECPAVGMIITAY